MAGHPREQVDQHFIDAARTLPARPRGDPALPVRAGARLTGRAALELFEAQSASRHLDLAARWLQAQGAGFYTIASAGHEGDAAVAAALRPTDPALLHYRSGAFFLTRAAQQAGAREAGAGIVNAIRDVLLGVVAAAEEPLAGGRHKVFGSRPLAVIPQTSTIGSHLPRAVGLAFAIDRARKVGVASGWPAGAVVICGFGDASVNHSTTAGALNAAGWCAWQGLPLPLLLLCEDNGIGISVRSPAGWTEAALRARPGIRYFAADGADLAGTFDVAEQAVGWVRERRRPAVLHLRTVRFGGHVGSDVETAYRSPAEIAADLDRDPLLGTARLLVGAGLLTPDEVIGRYEAARARVLAVAREVSGRRRLASAAHVMQPIAPDSPAEVAAAACRLPRPADRQRQFDGRLPEREGGLTLAQAVNRTLLDAGLQHPGLLVFGEDVAGKGGVYGVTRGLAARLGPARVFDTLLDEQAILGLGLGAGLAGLLPVPEVQYLAFLHNAEDQIRGEAATLQFFSNGQFRNPIVLRVAGYGYQKGFGGHFHNDNAVGVLRDVPGLVLASPARPDDAAAMLRTCLAAATVDGRVCVFLEPIALYHTRDLHADGDRGWLADYPAPATWAERHVPIGRGRSYGEGADLTIVTFGNGLRMSLRVARRLAVAAVHCRVLDLRWLAPLPIEDLLREARATGRVLVVDETRRTGGVAEGVLAALIDAGYPGSVRRVASEDSFIPLGDAAAAVLVSEAAIEAAALDLAFTP
jgi:2-oxoisovalerate dehydrogenase E1 component